MAVKSMVKSGMSKVFQDNLNQDRHRYGLASSRFTDLRKSCKLSREDETLLSQLRTGESRMMGVLRSRLGIGSELCRWCNIHKETIQHVYSECENTKLNYLKLKMNVKDVKVLFDNPELGLEFCHEVIKLVKN